MIDFMKTDRYLLNGMHLRIVLHRNSPEFALLCSGAFAGERYQIKIEDCFLRLFKLKINPAILMVHGKILNTIPAKYPYIKSETKVANVASGQTVFLWDYVNSNFVPNLIVIGFVKGSAVLGDVSKNTFNFEHFDLRQISVKINGVPCAGSPINCNYNDQLTAEVLDRMYGISRGQKLTSAIPAVSSQDRHSIGIDRSELANGKAIYVFDLKPIIEDTYHFELLKPGSVSVDASFGVALTANVSCICYMESDALLEIDQSRVVRHV